MDRSCTRPQEASLCFFCLTPVQTDKNNDEHTLSNNQYLIACCKKLLKDEIRGNSNERFSPAKHSSTLCVNCLKSALKVQNVSKQLMKIDKVLDGLTEKFTIEVSERVSRHSEYEEEIKVEDIISIKDDVDCIQEDNDIELHGDLETRSENNCSAELRFAGQIHDNLPKTSPQVRKRSRKSVLVPRLDFYGDRNNEFSNYLDADSPLTDAIPELFTSDALQSSDIKHEEPVPSPIQIFSDGELDHSDGNEDDPLSLGVNSVESAKGCISNYFPRVLLHKLQFDSTGQVINPVKGSSMLGKRKSAIKAVENLRRVAQAEESNPSIKRKYVSRTAKSSALAPSSLNLISLPVTSYELTNLMCFTCNKQFSEFQSLLNHKQSPCNITNDLKTQISTATQHKIGSRNKKKTKLKTLISQISKHKRKLDKQRREKVKAECKICGRPTNVINLNTHMLSHRGEHEKRYRCSFCGKGFNYKEMFEDHVENYHSSVDEGSYVCNFCGKRWKTKKRLRVHLYTHRNFSCSKCNLSFQSRLALIRHENMHSGKVYSCSLCSKSFLSERLLKRHKSLHHSGDGRRQFNVQKSACNKSYVLSRDLSKVAHEGKRPVFECPICKKDLQSAGGFKNHMINHGDKEFTCDICGSSFATMKQLNVHSLNHEEEECMCMICGKKFQNTRRLRAHEVNHEKERNNVCEHCGYKAKCKETLQRHIRSVHEMILDYECSICGKGFTQKPNCLKHERAHQDKTMRDTKATFNCNICDNNFTDPNCLRLHQIYFHTAYTQQFADCDKCFNKFSNALELHRHTKESQKESLTRYILRCVHCKICFESRCDLLCHVANDHPGEEIPYKCQVCFIVLSSPFLLKEHLNDECGKNILVEKRRKQVTKKERTANTKERTANTKERTANTKERKKDSDMKKTPFICSFCGKSFAGKFNLTKHEEIHANKKPFECSLCGKGFALKAYLKLHEKVHTNEKAFECSFCSKRFHQKCNLKKHERIHTGETPFQCTFCPKAFKQSDQLKTHIRIHTGEKPYSCTVCAKKFSDHSTLSKHRKIHAQ